MSGRPKSKFKYRTVIPLLDFAVMQWCGDITTEYHSFFPELCIPEFKSPQLHLGRPECDDRSFYGKQIPPHLNRHLIIVTSWHMTIDTVIADRWTHHFRLPAV